MISLKRVGTSLLCCLLCILPVMGEPQSGGQRAGQIDAMIPAATVNSQTAQVKEALQWNDLLATADSGRVRAGLSDGSLLSLGSSSQLRIVQHDAASQQTSLEMDFGKVRSQVVKITKPGGKFQMKTPNAVIGVVGTDFFAGYANDQTTVICYSGRVTVTPIGSAQVAQNGGQSAGNSVTVGPGQMVVVTSVVPATGFQVTQATPSQINGSISDTGVSVPGAPVLARGGHALRNGLIVTGIALGVGLGVGLGEQGNKTAGKCEPSAGVCP
ncbi:MAG TPA: FecR family protein [Candidatus Aquilonibacter sp.]|nr:FecR family protein [Candidatus Aquilonibacter sp.]